MILNKFREKLYIKKHIKIPIDQLEKQISNFNCSKPIAICPKPLENNWQGISSATEGLFPGRTFHLPQYFSNTPYTNKELNEIANLLIKNNSEHIIFSGYLAYFNSLIIPIANSGKKVSVIYHGSHTSILEDSNAALHFKSLIQLSKQSILYKIGFVKKDMDKTFNLLTGENFYSILLKTDEALFSINPNQYDGLNIGVLTYNLFRKNLYNMVSAALLNKDAIVHMKKKYLSDYLDNSERIKFHDTSKNKTEFLKILGGMSINLYVSFSECWGQLVSESLAMGVPCLSSDVSAVLDFDEDLKKLLIVKEFDNDFAIYKKTKEVIENKIYFNTYGPKYIRKLNTLADQKITEFIY
jgi:glycosyltransferase involved in cell wall biosynthesis